MNESTLGKSRIVKNMMIGGFTTNNIFVNEEGEIIVKGGFHSHENKFHVYAKSIKNTFNVSEHINNLLIIIDSENNALVHEDNFPLMIQSTAKRNIKENSPVFRKDIFDIKSISFKDILVDLNPKDGQKIIWLFREGFSFGLYFDLTGKLASQNASEEMARLYSAVIYYELYNSLSEENINSLIKIGWFPFLQLIDDGYEVIFNLLENNKLEDISKWSETIFPNDRIKNFTEGWWDRKSFNDRKVTLSEGLECFYEGKYAACISTLIPMVEGISNLINKEKTGKYIKPSGDKISKSISIIAQDKHSSSSVAFPILFEKYLKEHFFVNSTSSVSDSAVRHTVAHGRASDKSFNRDRALQIILTLDQIRFYC